MPQTAALPSQTGEEYERTLTLDAVLSPCLYGRLESTERTRARHERVTAIREEKVREKFHHLLKQWRIQRRFISSLDEIEACPAHQEIVNMGWEVVPLIMEQIEKGVLSHWFGALELITGDQPVEIEDHGDYRKMGQAWLNWWKDRSSIPTST